MIWGLAIAYWALINTIPERKRVSEIERESPCQKTVSQS